MLKLGFGGLEDDGFMVCYNLHTSMIGFLKGKIEHRDDPHLLIEVNEKNRVML